MTKHFAHSILLAVILGSSLLVQCKKKKELSYIVEGKIFDPNYNSAVSNAEVKLYSKEISNGSISANFSLKESAKTGVDGKYVLEFDRTNVVEYKLVVTRANYFSSEEIIKQDQLIVDEVNKKDVNLYPKAFFKFNIINSNPIDDFDMVDVYFDKTTSFQCSECCGNQRYILNGQTVDTTIVCTDWANKELSMQYLVVKMGSAAAFNNSLFGKIGDTTTFDILY